MCRWWCTTARPNGTRRCGWAPPELRDLQPRLACRLVDAKDCASGGDAADGNLARAALALDAASADGLPLALERAEELFAAAGDRELRRSFAAWCGGMLGPRLGDRLPALDDKETTMLAETLRERDEMKIDEGRRQGMRAGRQEGLQQGMRAGRQEVLAEERTLLCSLAGRRFGADTGSELAALLAGVEDGAELARIGTLIIDCRSGADFLARARLRR